MLPWGKAWLSRMGGFLVERLAMLLASNEQAWGAGVEASFSFFGERVARRVWELETQFDAAQAARREAEAISRVCPQAPAREAARL